MYAAAIRALAEESPTGQVDLVVHSYSAFELSIVFEHDEGLKDLVGSVLLLAPTKVRSEAFDGVDVQVLYEEHDWIREMPVGPLQTRLDSVDSIDGATVTVYDYPKLDTCIMCIGRTEQSHDGWFSVPDMITELTTAVARL